MAISFTRKLDIGDRVYIQGGESLRIEMTKQMNYPIEVRDFELLPRNYAYFWTNTLGKSKNVFIVD